MIVRKYWIATMVLVVFCGWFTITATSVDVDEAVTTMDNVDDSLLAIQLTTDGLQDLNELKEDPTNTEKLTENIVKPLETAVNHYVGDYKDPDVVASRMYALVAFIILVKCIALAWAILNRA